MPDDRMSQAIREAYASAPSNVVILDTLEIWHPSFVEDGVPKPIFVVRNYEDTATWIDLGGAEVEEVLDAIEEKDRKQIGLVARLEATALRLAGQMVPFVAYAFDVERPPIDTAPLPEITLTIDNVSREISQKVEEAATSQASITVTYREYISTDIDGPQLDPPITFTLSNVSVSPVKISGKARIRDIGNKLFPAKTYTAKRFPGLVR